jgi:hypothetical protein
VLLRFLIPAMAAADRVDVAGEFGALRDRCAAASWSESWSPSRTLLEAAARYGDAGCVRNKLEIEPVATRAAVRVVRGSATTCRCR